MRLNKTRFRRSHLHTSAGGGGFQSIQFAQAAEADTAGSTAGLSRDPARELQHPVHHLAPKLSSVERNGGGRNGSGSTRLEACDVNRVATHTLIASRQRATESAHSQAMALMTMMKLQGHTNMDPIMCVYER